MTLALILATIVLGIVLILIEIFLTPGFIVGTVGTLLIVVGIAFVYRDFGTVYGNISLVSSLVILGFAVTMAFRGGAWSRFTITDEISGKANNSHEWNINIGDRGVALSALRPSGTAMINDTKVEVHTEGGFLLTNDQVEVIKRVQNKIIVKKIES
jgi:membrane-bound ClpP family serine protease